MQRHFIIFNTIILMGKKEAKYLLVGQLFSITKTWHIRKNGLESHWKSHSSSIWRLNMVKPFHCNLLYLSILDEVNLKTLMFCSCTHRNRIWQVKSCHFWSKYRQVVIIWAVFHSRTNLNNKMSRKERGQRCKQMQRFLALSLGSKH